MAKLKATERLDYFISDLWDTGNRWIDNINKALLFTMGFPLAIYMAVIIASGAFFNWTYLPFSELFVNLSITWSIVSFIAIPILTPFIFLLIFWTIIWTFIWIVFDAIFKRK